MIGDSDNACGASIFLFWMLVPINARERVRLR
jgi:hypothetical protein